MVFFGGFGLFVGFGLPVAVAFGGGGAVGVAPPEAPPVSLVVPPGVAFATFAAVTVLQGKSSNIAMIENSRVACLLVIFYFLWVGLAGLCPRLALAGFSVVCVVPRLTYGRGEPTLLGEVPRPALALRVIPGGEASGAAIGSGSIGRGSGSVYSRIQAASAR